MSPFKRLLYLCRIEKKHWLNGPRHASPNNYPLQYNKKDNTQLQILQTTFRHGSKLPIRHKETMWQTSKHIRKNIVYEIGFLYLKLRDAAHCSANTFKKTSILQNFIILTTTLGYEYFCTEVEICLVWHGGVELLKPDKARNRCLLTISRDV